MKSDLTRRGFLGLAGTAAAGAAVTHAALADDGEGTSRSASIKIIGICCSFRKGRSTVASMRLCLDAAKQVDPEVIEVELIDLAEMKIDGSLAAGLPLEPGQKDDFPDLIPKLSDPAVAGIIIGTPVYFGNMSSLCKAFLERCMAFRKDEFALGNKVGGVLAVGGARNGGQELTIKSVQTALLCQNMIVVGEAKPSCHSGAAVWNNGEDFLEDKLNKATASSLGQRVAEVALRMAGR